MDISQRKLLLTIGVSGSGKSTFAKELVKMDNSWVEINRDEIRAKLFLQGNQSNMWKYYKFTKHNENLVNLYAEDLFKQSVANFKNIIISDTNINPKTREYWKQLSIKYKYEYSEKIFGLELTIDDLIKIDNLRVDKPVGYNTIIYQWVKFYSQFGEIYIKDPTKNNPKAIIVDIDGTIADKSPLRNHYDWHLVGLDSPRKFIIYMVKSIMKIHKCKCIFLSGRDSSCYDITKEWIIQNTKIPEKDFSLYMRNFNDKRNDRIIKKELFFQFIADNWDVISAIDDRPRIVRLWKDLKIPNVIDVSTSYIEF